jgi:hypothetical protein
MLSFIFFFSIIRNKKENFFHFATNIPMMTIHQMQRLLSIRRFATVATSTSAGSGSTNAPKTSTGRKLDERTTTFKIVRVSENGQRWTQDYVIKRNEWYVLMSSILHEI